MSKVYKLTFMQEMVDIVDETNPPAIEIHGKKYVQVVQCKDCVYCKRYNDVWYAPKRDELLCTLYVETYHTTENDFCSRGERKDEVEEDENDKCRTFATTETVYNRYTDTAGNYHWTGAYSGHHIVRMDGGERRKDGNRDNS